MDWARILAYAMGTVDQELLATVAEMAVQVMSDLAKRVRELRPPFQLALVLPLPTKIDTQSSADPGFQIAEH